MNTHNAPDKKEDPGCNGTPQKKNKTAQSSNPLLTRLSRFKLMAAGKYPGCRRLEISQNNRLYTITYGFLVSLLYCILQYQAHAEHKLVDNFKLKELQKKTYTMHFDESRQQLQINGTMEIGILTEFKHMLVKHPELAEVSFNSNGGNIYQARGLAKVIMSKQLNTHVSENCYSACTIAFVAGNIRYLGTEGRLGFHQYNIKSKMLNQHFDLEKEQARDLSYFKSRISSNTFIQKIFNSKNTELWIPEQRDLLATGVIHEIVPDPDR